MRILRTLVAVIVCLVVAPRASHADPFTIHVLSTQYLTEVSTDRRLSDGLLLAPTVRRTVSSSGPVSDFMEVPSTMPRIMGALASADTFALLASTGSGFTDEAGETNEHSVAFAQTTLDFMPMTDGLATIGLNLTAGGNVPEFSRGRASVTNMTTSEVLWDIGWDYAAFLDVPWTVTPRFDPRYAAELMLPTLFNATDQYRLLVSVGTDANFDWQKATVEVSGLKTVPEPSSLLLLGTVLAGGGVRRWRARRPRT